MRGHSEGWAGYKAHLTETCDPDRPHLIVHVETTSAAVTVIALLAPDPASNAAGVLPLLMLLAAMRFSWPGLVAAAVAGEVALGLLAIIQVGVLRVTDAPTAAQEWVSRVVLITLTLAVGGALPWSGHRWQRWHRCWSTAGC